MGKCQGRDSGAVQKNEHLVLGITYCIERLRFSSGFCFQEHLSARQEGIISIFKKTQPVGSEYMFVSGPLTIMG